ncbi:GNAT family N-acetyltransferase [Sporomusa termitida]|uniref:Acetyltransferase (GNAT) family protein n=1 Tax=Sporomusa termitida TaxID=2377 RepID=A0A517DRF1_9FIRM|nr:GNAT family N-acetyltransferase [Sporomusa termitida]QDR79935.1 Acetyltransferase (GNAT) family protein [Sporomusa termitida]
MLFRQAAKAEIPFLFQEGYKEWSKSRTFEQYCIDNSKDDAIGTRYVIEESGQILSSAVLMRLNSIKGKDVYGLGSILTSKNHRGKGYGSELVKKCINLIPNNNIIIFLYSDINPSYYEKLGFQILPKELQKYENSVCMAYCNEFVWPELINAGVDVIPNYF